MAEDLLCASCSTVVGAVDERAEGWRLHKWSVALGHADDDDGPAETHALESWVAAQLLALADAQGVRKFVVHGGGGEGGDGEGEEGLLVS